MTDAQKLAKAEEDLRTINKIIYGKGASLNSREYFDIREIASAYERKK